MPDTETSVDFGFLEAAKIHLRARVKEAEAKLALYSEFPVGVADHSNIVEEILKAADEGSAALEKLDFLESRYP
jgi:gamma-glutamylcyclotransferase (GGCT)/AIG2-like uncharacterized protein YtfP